MSNQSSTKTQFQQAHELITAQRYKEARQLLQQIDHPKAQEWLTQLEDKQKQTPSGTLFTSTMLAFGIGATVVILGLVLAFLYLPTLIESLQPNAAEQYLDETFVSEEESLYSHVASYCYQITGYGGELCLDWADLVMAEYQATATSCLESYVDLAEIKDEDYVTIQACFTDASVPPPY